MIKCCEIEEVMIKIMQTKLLVSRAFHKPLVEIENCLQPLKNLSEMFHILEIVASFVYIPNENPKILSSLPSYHMQHY